MKNTTRSYRLPSTLALLFVLTLMVMVWLMAGCTKKLDGEVADNQAPIVWFVNIPPEGQQFSINPVIYWYGTDNDGLISYYRYHVWAVPDGNTLEPMEYVQSVHDSDWVYLFVEPAESDPKTQTNVPMSADLDDPVTKYVELCVFLQAFDMEGGASSTVYRVFYRNDHPPNTILHRIPSSDKPFVNSCEPGGTVTGIKVRWEGEDPIDYAKEPPPFEFEWRLYGPYNETTLGDTILTDFVTSVYVTQEGKRYNSGDYVKRCDTTLEADTVIITCDSCYVESTQVFHDCIADLYNADFGRFEPYLQIDDEDFISKYGNVAARSSKGDTTRPDNEWVMDTQDTIYCVYKDVPSDTTITEYFLFWVRARDDAFVADLVPAYDTFLVIDPRFERKVIVVDFTDYWPFGRTEPKSIDSTKAFWRDMLTAWDPSLTDTSLYNDQPIGANITPDYIRLASLTLPLEPLLKHRVMILYNDCLHSSEVFDPVLAGYQNTFKAIDAGINTWLTMRCPVMGGIISEPSLYGFPIPEEYRRYFGVSGQVFANWLCHAGHPNCERYRIEDFIGAYSLDPYEWPELNIDSAILHAFYNWGFPWVDSIYGLPEVDWSMRAYGTEPMYLYKSLYSKPESGGDGEHPMGFLYTYEGSPVAHRYNRGIFRTVHFNFTLPAIPRDTARLITTKVMDWLYDPWLTEPVSKMRYSDGPPEARLTIEEARQHYWERNERLAREQQAEPIIESEW